jgi:hypothetical protein
VLERERERRKVHFGHYLKDIYYCFHHQLFNFNSSEKYMNICEAYPKRHDTFEVFSWFVFLSCVKSCCLEKWCIILNVEVTTFKLRLVYKMVISLKKIIIIYIENEKMWNKIALK